jgi:hypothetical protein
MQRSRTYCYKVKVLHTSIFVLLLLHLLRCSITSSMNLQNNSHCSTPCLNLFKCLCRTKLYTRMKFHKYGGINIFLKNEQCRTKNIYKKKSNDPRWVTNRLLAWRPRNNRLIRIMDKPIVSSTKSQCRFWGPPVLHYKWYWGSLFLWVEWPSRENNHSIPSRAGVENEWR